MEFTWKKRICKYIHPILPPFSLLLWYTVFLIICIYNKVQITSQRNLAWQDLAITLYAICT
jgi:hypothetical protein